MVIELAPDRIDTAQKKSIRGRNSGITISEKRTLDQNGNRIKTSPIILGNSENNSEHIIEQLRHPLLDEKQETYIFTKITEFGERHNKRHIPNMSVLFQLTFDEKEAVLRSLRKDTLFIDSFEENSQEKSYNYKEVLAKCSNIEDFLLRCNFKLILTIANKYSLLPLDDRLILGQKGFIDALKRYDPSLGNRLSTHATWWVRQAISRGTVESGYTIRIPEGTYRALRKANKLIDKYEQISGQSLTEDEIKKVLSTTTELKLTQATINTIVDIRRNNIQNIASLDIVPDTVEEVPLIATLDSSIDIESEVLNDIRMEALRNAISRLEDPDKDIIALRFGLHGSLPLTFGEIGEQLGISTKCIRELYEIGLTKLRDDPILKKEGFGYQI